MKKADLILFFLTGLATICTAETIVDRPPFSVSNTSMVEIEKVIICDTATILEMVGYINPGGWIRLSSDSYIQADNQKWKVKGTKGIKLDEEIHTNAAGDTRFSLIFPPIKPSSKKIDFIESDCKECFKIWGIELQSKTLTDRLVVPKEVIDATKIKKSKTNLPVPVLQQGDAILKGRILGYRPEMDQKIQTFVNNPITGDQETQEININADGGYEAKIPLICTTRVLFRLNNYNKFILLSPDQETNIYVDLQQKSQQEARLRVDKTAPTNVVYFSGANAEVNNQLSRSNDFNFPKDYSLFMKEIVNMTAPQYKDYVLKEYSSAQNELKKSNLTQKALEIAELSLQYEVLYHLFFSESNLEDAFRRANKLNYGDPMIGFTKPIINIDYYSFLKDFPLNNPMSLYAEGYSNIINSCKYVDSRKARTTFNYLTAEMAETLIRSGKLSPEEKDCADYFIREDFKNWDVKRASAFREINAAYSHQLLATDKLSESEKAEVENLLSLSSNPKTAILELLETRLTLDHQILSKNADLPKDNYKPITLSNFYLNSDSSFAEKGQAFFEKYGVDIQNLQKKMAKNRSLKVLENILGTNQGLLFDLLQTQMCSSELEKYTPITTEDLEKVSNMDNPFFGKYLKFKNDELLAKMEANKRKGGYRVLETPQVANEQLFEALIKPFAGKVIFVDFWATWCAPCRNAMKLMEPSKKNYLGKEIVFVYVTNESSPLTIFQNMIPDIPGEHYRLSGEKFNYLADKFGMGGIPSYVILGKTGQQIYFQTGFEGVEKITGLLNQELTK